MFLIASHHIAKFSDHIPCGSSNTAAKTFFVNLQENAIKESGDFMEKNSWLYILNLTKLIAIIILLIDMKLF